jgi:putative ABC transport system permease protein
VRLAAVGLAVGGAVSVPVGLAIATELYGVSGTDPVSFLLVAGLLLAASVVAAYVPARRAARVDPMTALRCD